jgi:uncharacterized protein
MDPVLQTKMDVLDAMLREHGPLVIAYSGGVDSACLLAAAHRTLGNRMLGVIADSPSLPRNALAAAVRLAERIGAPIEVVETQELANPDYASNPMNRCYFCKAELFAKLDAIARERGFRAIAYGENADDAHHFRPGSKAAAEFHVLAPLKAAGLTKEEVRRVSRAWNLPTADAPAQPCLSSRIPHGTPVTTDALRMVENGEEWVRSLGFKVFRVRHIAGGEPEDLRARVQIAPDEMSRLPTVAEPLVSGLKAVGYREVEIDPAGYQAPA